MAASGTAFAAGSDVLLRGVATGGFGAPVGWATGVRVTRGAVVGEWVVVTDGAAVVVTDGAAVVVVEVTGWVDVVLLETLAVMVGSVVVELVLEVVELTGWVDVVLLETLAVMVGSVVVDVVLVVVLVVEVLLVVVLLVVVLLVVVLGGAV